MDPSFSYLGGLVVGGRDCKTHQVRNTFLFLYVEKVHAVGARRTFGSQECKKLTGTEHFWTFRYRFVWQAQGIAHLVKHEQDVRVCCSFNYNHHYITLITFQSTTLNYTTTTTTTTTTLRYTTLRYANYTSLRYTALNYTTLHYTTPHYTNYTNYTNITLTTLSTLITLTTTTATLHYITSCNYNYTTLHYTRLDQLHYTPLHSTTLTTATTTTHYITLHHTTLH